MTESLAGAMVVVHCWVKSSFPADIFVAIDRFSKACPLIPLKKFPSLEELAYFSLHVRSWHMVHFMCLKDFLPNWLHPKTSFWIPSSNYQTNRNQLTESLVGCSVHFVVRSYTLPVCARFLEPEYTR